MSRIRAKYKHIYFEKGPTDWMCCNNDDLILGDVEYYTPWKQWVFSSGSQMDGDYVFSASCLRDIANFMEQLKCQE